MARLYDSSLDAVPFNWEVDEPRPYDHSNEPDIFIDGVDESPSHYLLQANLADQMNNAEWRSTYIKAWHYGRIGQAAVVATIFQIALEIATSSTIDSRDSFIIWVATGTYAYVDSRTLPKPKRVGSLTRLDNRGNL